MSRFAAAAAMLAVTACAGPSDPEQELRALIDAAARAAEERDVGFFRDLIADGYRDERGNDRDAAINALRGYFVTHPNVTVATRVTEVRLEGADAARVVVQAALVGLRGESRFGLDGNLYRIELELVGGSGDWRLIGARWERALGE